MGRLPYRLRIRIAAFPHCKRLVGFEASVLAHCLDRRDAPDTLLPLDTRWALRHGPVMPRHCVCVLWRMLGG